MSMFMKSKKLSGFVCACSEVDYDVFYFAIPKILHAPRATITKTIEPTTRSGILEFVRKTSTPARITPTFTITSFDVKIMLAWMWASSLLLFCSR